MVGVDQVVAIVAGAHQDQAHQRRLFQLEATGAFFLGQGIERHLHAGLVTPVQQTEGDVELAVDQLHRLFEIALPEEPGAQDVVTVQYCLPGRAEARGLQLLDVEAGLVDVVAAGLLEQRVEQHALLHR